MSTVAVEMTVVTAAWRELQNNKAQNRCCYNMHFLKGVGQQSHFAIVLMKLKPTFCTK